eukprot:scaffold226736_cov55-Prasinocladus_malaysianus.AAC.1
MYGEAKPVEWPVVLDLMSLASIGQQQMLIRKSWSNHTALWAACEVARREQMEASMALAEERANMQQLQARVAPL